MIILLLPILLFGQTAGIAMHGSSLWFNGVSDYVEIEPYPPKYSSIGDGAETAGSVIVGDYLYWLYRDATAENNSIIQKVNLVDPTIQDSLILSHSLAETMETDETYLYVMGMDESGTVEKIRLSDFTIVDELDLSEDAGVAGSHIVGTDLYVACFTAPGKIVKVDLNTFTETDVETFESGENQAEGMDDDGEFLYVALEQTSTPPGKIGRVKLDDFSRDSVITMHEGENQIQDVLVVGNYVYAVSRVSPGIIIKIPLNDFDRDADDSESLTLDTGEDEPNVILNIGDNDVYVSCRVSPQEIVKIDLTTFTKYGSLTLNSAVDGGESIINNGVDLYVFSYSYSADKSYTYKFNIPLWDKYVSLPNDFNIDTGTISAWFYLKKYSSSDVLSAIISQDDGGYSYDFALGPDNSNKIKFFLQDNTQTYDIFSNSTVNLNQWYFVTVTFGAGGMKMYLNGILQTDTDSYTGGFYSSGAVTQIGRHQTTANRYFNGIISEAMVYNRTLGSTEILWNYNNPSKIYSTDSLKGYWKFNEYTGTVVYNNENVGNHGTIYDAKWSIETPVISARCVKE